MKYLIVIGFLVFIALRVYGCAPEAPKVTVTYGATPVPVVVQPAPATPAPQPGQPVPGQPAPAPAATEAQVKAILDETAKIADPETRINEAIKRLDAKFGNSAKRWNSPQDINLGGKSFVWMSTKGTPLNPVTGYVINDYGIWTGSGKVNMNGAGAAIVVSN